MKRFIGICLAGMLVLSLSGAGRAGEFDGSAPMLCAVVRAMECVPDRGCTEITLESAGLPRFAVIDPEKKHIRRAGDNLPGQTGTRTSAIEGITSIDGKLILQGAEDGIEGVRDGLGWTIAVEEESGDLVLTASGHDVAFVVFGACTVSHCEKK